METVIVLTQCPDTEVAEAIAAALVERRLAACVSQLAPCRSTYRWEGRVEHAVEIPLLIKTRADTYAAVEAAIRERHPYAIPEIVALPVAHGLPAFLDWVAAETRRPD